MTFGSCIRAAAFAWLAVPAQLIAQVGNIRGQVTDVEGDPVVRAVVVLVASGARTETDASGQFALRRVPAGRHELQVARLGLAPVSKTVVVPVGGTAEIAIEMPLLALALEALSVIGSETELDETRQRLLEIPGSVALVEPAELRRTRQANFKDILRFTPGVHAQPRFGAADESQLSIRGSGLRNNFHLRGVNVLVNGMPYRNADGFTDFESLELLTANNVQVYKGANSLRFGGATLGGAINIETQTGNTAAPLNVFAQSGLYDSYSDDLPFFKGQLSSGYVLGDLDYYASYARTQVGSYREYADQRRDRVNAHLGYRLSPTVDARAFYLFAYVEEDLPGSLTRAEFTADPRQANPANVQNRWGRDYSLHHAGVQLRAQLSPTQRLEFAPYGQFRDIVHPIFRVLDQVSADVGAELRYENTGGLAGHRNRLAVGFQPAWGRTDNRHFENVGGERGDLAKDQIENAAMLSAYAEDVLGLSRSLSLVAGLRYDRALRKVRDEFLADGDQTDERWMDQLSPKVGVLYDLSAVSGQVYANVSRAVEPPLLLELNSLTVLGFVDLSPQRAWQFEVGTRGSAAGLAWDVAVYDMELWDELINVNVQPFPTAAFTVPTYRNVPRTRHRGVEAGIDYRVPGTVFTPTGDELGIRVAYTYQRFSYVEDPDFAGHDLPGAPHHLLNAEIAYRHPSGVVVRPTVEWVPGNYFVNSGNTETNHGWTVLGLRAEWLVPAGNLTVFLEGRNLTDEVYSPAVTVDDASGRFFLPSDGRSVYAGFRWQP
jgi:iron complex outermembrane receptor protein